jgi:penicillin amidase
MAGDPHLQLTLPSIWYQLTVDSPTYHVSGVSIPGTPVVLIGHNQHISWSLTDAQNQQTFFYVEHEDKSHPGQYLWKGAWQHYGTAGYDIPVLGGATQHLTVKTTVHGPVITERGQTTSVWWAGNIPSQDLDVLLSIDRAASWQDFRDALRGWHSPTHNFVYADDAGNIGLISAGYFPQVPAGARPWLPMPGTGEADITGTIPYDSIPQVYDPPSGIVWSANQRQVTASYPYYIGTTSNFFDPGYRANEIHRVLSLGAGPSPGCPSVAPGLCAGAAASLTSADMKALQTDTRDFLASEMVPTMVTALTGERLSRQESTALNLLEAWNYRMDVGSAAASVWWTFWQSYLGATFDPWWKSRRVPVARSELNDALTQDLEAWTLGDPSNQAFNAPGAGARNATAVIRQAFHATVATLAKQLGADPRSWTWGRIHTRVLHNLAQVTGLDYGPKPDRGDAYTPLAAPGFPSTLGPSWRMVVDWGSHTFDGIYPGGPSEDPASDWYTNQAQAWWDGLYLPMLGAGAAAASSGSVSWDMRP